MGLAVVPTDWTDEYIDVCVNWPNSPEWLAILRGQLTEPYDVKFWDKFTGDPAEAQTAIEETFNQNLHVEECIMMPSGLITFYAGLTPPSGWLECDGSEVSRSTYANLFAAIGTFYGTGNGTTTFDLPNPGGRVIQAFYPDLPELGAIGDVFGENQHIVTISEMPIHGHIQDSHNHTQNSHNHTQNSHNHTQNSHVHSPTGNPVILGASASFVTTSGSAQVKAEAAPAVTATNQATTPTNQATTPTNQATTPTNQNTGGDGAHENRQPTIVQMCIIKI